MGAAKAIDEQINEYLNQLNPKQKKAVLTVVKTFAEEGYDDHWDDPAFIGELDRRSAEFEAGKIKTYTTNEVEAAARKAYKQKHRNKK